MKQTDEEKFSEIEEYFLADFEIAYKNFLHNWAVGENDISSGNISFMVVMNKTDSLDEESKNKNKIQIRKGFSKEK